MCPRSSPELPLWGRSPPTGLPWSPFNLLQFPRGPECNLAVSYMAACPKSQRAVLSKRAECERQTSASHGKGTLSPPASSPVSQKPPRPPHRPPPTPHSLAERTGFPLRVLLLPGVPHADQAAPTFPVLPSGTSWPEAALSEGPAGSDGHGWYLGAWISELPLS